MTCKLHAVCIGIYRRDQLVETINCDGVCSPLTFNEVEPSRDARPHYHQIASEVALHHIDRISLLHLSNGPIPTGDTMCILHVPALHQAPYMRSSSGPGPVSMEVEEN